MGWQDREYERTDDMMVYPFVQWVNAGGSLEPRSDTGGFALPLDQAAILGTQIPGEVRVLHHRGGDRTEVVFTAALEAAVLATRFAWIKDGQVVPAYEPGARGKLQALALVRDAGGHTAGPVMLTFKGHTSKQFSEAMKAHRESVRKATANKAPAYAFFGAYQAGEVQMVGSGQQSPVTTIGLTDGFDPDAAYVGDEALDVLDWDQVDGWKTAWDQPEGANGNGNGARSKPEPKNPDAAASEAQWRLVRKLLSDLGYADEAKQDEAIGKAGYNPEDLTMGQASELIERLQTARQKNGQ
jgi:hypothetical protein